MCVWALNHVPRRARGFHQVSQSREATNMSSRFHRESGRKLAADPPGRVIVIMGVSGSGKTTIGQSLAEHLSCAFHDGDDFHPQTSIDKMKRGIPLSDEDRYPWLLTLRDLIAEILSRGNSAIVACSALKRNYRQILRSPGLLYTLSPISFICLEAPADVLAERLDRRSTAGSHFMPASLLQSQLDLLQIEDDEVDILRVDSSWPLDDILSFIDTNSL